MAATLEGIKTIPTIPRKGEQYLSVNLALVSLPELVTVAQSLGFKTEVVQIHQRSGTEVHALLWEGMMTDAAADLNERIDALADRIDTKSIRSVRGGWSQQAA
jgi:hypothetical protein